MDKVIVFGGSGFLGSYVCDALHQSGYAVVNADRSSSQYQNYEFIECDLLKPETLSPILSDPKIIAVYNFAGFSNLSASCKEPKSTIELNVMGNLNVLEAVIKNPSIKRFIYASSAYAQSKNGSFYGISKYTSEKIIEEYARQYELAFTIIRYGSLYGERADENNGMYVLLKNALKNKKIVFNGNGEEIREYIHAEDAAKLSVQIMTDPQYQNEHLILTGTEKMKQKDLLDLIKEVLNDQIEITYNQKENSPHYRMTPYSYHPNIAKKLTANPFIDIGQGIVNCIRAIEHDMD